MPSNDKCGRVQNKPTYITLCTLIKQFYLNDFILVELLMFISLLVIITI